MEDGSLVVKGAISLGEARTLGQVNADARVFLDWGCGGHKGESDGDEGSLAEHGKES